MIKFLNVEDIAKTCHQAKRAYCTALGDFSQPHWDAVPEWQKKSAINGVIFHIKNPFNGEQAAHDNWMQEKLKDGWVYGPVKDAERKQHPCIVQYADLPAEQQAKDYIFTSIVQSLGHLVDPVELDQYPLK